VGIRRNNFSKDEIERIKEVHSFIHSNEIELDDKIKIDQFFIEYKSLINEKLGHIQE
jgi:acyl-[acyl carrier protein]--UDP-N-acetylglucosamine O-acyltransferase